MRNAGIFTILLLVIFLSCKKTNYSSVPNLTFKTVNTTVLSRNQSIQFSFDFTDQEGDLDSIYISKIIPNCPTGFIPFSALAVPSFPSGHNKGTVLVTLQYSQISPQCPPQNDTATFKFLLKDKAQHLSDTAVAPTIIILN